eukprot:6731939-Pyramimonas_sp.AAC.1
MSPVQEPVRGVATSQEPRRSVQERVAEIARRPRSRPPLRRGGSGEDQVRMEEFMVIPGSEGIVARPAELGQQSWTREGPREGGVDALGGRWKQGAHDLPPTVEVE